MQSPVNYGLLNINKPQGITSRQVVNHVQRLVRPLKCGHAGTLDPLATGVLVVCVGAATRLIQRVQQMPKRYRGTFLLGRSSPTEDIEGEITLEAKPYVPTRAELEAILPRFTGVIQQKPPVYSALKVAGRRAYDLARQGETVELTAREIQVHSIELIDYTYPEFTLDIHCGSGTYVRSLGRDIALALNTQAVMSALERTQIGAFEVSSAATLDQLTAETLPEYLQSVDHAVPDLPKVILDAKMLHELSFGREIDLTVSAPGSELVGLNQDGEVVALLKMTSQNRWRPFLNFFIAQS